MTNQNIQANDLSQTEPQKYVLTITKDGFASTDPLFDEGDLTLGNNYVPLDVYFKKANGDKITRKYRKNERRRSNQVLPRLAFQIYEDQIGGLSVEEKESFPICRYTADSETIKGIFSSEAEFRSHRNSMEFLKYSYGEGRGYYIYCWNIFSTLIFVRECLKRFGEDGDSFVLVYRSKDKAEQESSEPIEASRIDEAPAQETEEYYNKYSAALLESKNIIFHGAPGTGKTYLAKEIAADIISNGCYQELDKLSDNQKEQVEFVQFHPSYDYSDFVEGLRPHINGDDSLGFTLQDGIFKRFVERARENLENSQKTMEVIQKEASAEDAIKSFLESIDFDENSFKLKQGNEYEITNIDESYIYTYAPNNEKSKKVKVELDELRAVLESDKVFTGSAEVGRFFGRHTQQDSYIFSLYTEIKKHAKNNPTQIEIRQEKLKKYIFIIDEINRGEISKIFGELFFSIDPGYRGKKGEISTQYAGLHTNPRKKFYIPENVYIIGTMNDIDRSVDSFDFAMRRRFRFINVKADDTLEMLSELANDDLEEEVIKRMTALNKEIAGTEGLSEDYQIGAAYFLKLKTLSFDQLWTDHLQPLLQEYIQGMYSESETIKKFAEAYGYEGRDSEDDHETT